MSGLNKVTLIGNLGRDPEIRYSQQGLAVVNFSIATSEAWTDKATGDKQEKTEWHRIVSFGKQAEILEKYLTKGSKIYIEGRLQTRSWEKDGNTFYTTEIIVQSFLFLGGNKQQGDQYGQDNPDGRYGASRYAGGSAGQQGPTVTDKDRKMFTDPSMGDGGPIPDDDIPF